MSSAGMSTVVGGARGLQGMDSKKVIALVAAGPLVFLLVVFVAREAAQRQVAVLEQAPQLQVLDSEDGDSAFEDHVTDQMRQLIKRAKKEKKSADNEDQKGLALAEKAKRTCMIAEHLHDTDDGLEKRARTQREASRSLEGHAAVLTDEADTQTQAYTGLHKKGTALRDQGTALKAEAQEAAARANQTNATLHPTAHRDLLHKAQKKRASADKLLQTATTILAKATLHHANAAALKADATKATTAASAVMQLGERFEREAVNHRLKTMTFRSKCTMMRARAQAALRKAQDEAKNAAVLDRIVKPQPAPDTAAAAAAAAPPAAS